MAQAKTQTLSLGEHWNHFIDEKVNTGRYASASELVRDSLRLLEEREANSQLEALRKALIKGEESGPAKALDMKEIIAEAKQKAGLTKPNA